MTPEQQKEDRICTPPSTENVRQVLLETASRADIQREQVAALCDTATLLYRPDLLDLPPEALKLAQTIDHTYLTITPNDPLHDLREVIRLCAEATEYRFKSVCVRPQHVSAARALLNHWGANDTVVCAVIDFPKVRGEIAGTAAPEIKSAEAIATQNDGAMEFDVVADYRAILNGDIRKPYEDIAAVSHAVKENDPGAIVKVILETALLRKWGGMHAVWDGANRVIEGGADFGKTSTGFAPEGGATPEDVELLATILHPCGVQVKASGEIKTLQVLESMKRAGADRFGLSGSVPIIQEKLRLLGWKE